MIPVTPTEFDVFLSHNGRDKVVVETIGEWLQTRALRVWLDVWELRPGLPWQEGLEEAVRASRAVAVFVGAEGLGAWQEPELRAFIARSRREHIPVIPVLLPGCPDSPQLSLFLETFTWVDLRSGLSETGLERLLWGITGARPEATGRAGASGGITGAKPEATPGAGPPANSKHPRIGWRRWSWEIALAVLGVAVTLAAWVWPRFWEPGDGSPKPEIYAVRVLVLDPEGRALEGAKVRASAGNEPHRLPDGWWELQIPLAKVPADGRVTLLAEHPEWRGGRTEVTLGRARNVRAELHLREPESWLRGQVTNDHDHSLAGVRIVRQDGGPGEARTDSAGRFEIKLGVPPETRVGLRAEYGSSPPENVFCYTGRDGCSIILDTARP